MKEHVLNSLRRAINEMESDLGSDVSLNDIAGAAHLSHITFRASSSQQQARALWRISGVDA